MQQNSTNKLLYSKSFFGCKIHIKHNSYFRGNTIVSKLFLSFKLNLGITFVVF